MRAIENIITNFNYRITWGGIASSLVLNSCSEKATILNNKDEAISYLQKHKQNTKLQHEFTSSYAGDSIEIEHPYFYYLIGDTTPDSKPIYTKQALINGLINNAIRDYNPELSIKLKIYNDKLIFAIWDALMSMELTYKINYWHSPMDCSILFELYVDNNPLGGPTTLSNHPNLIPSYVECNLYDDYSKYIFFSYNEVDEPTVSLPVSSYDYETLEVILPSPGQ